MFHLSVRSTTKAEKPQRGEIFVAITQIDCIESQRDGILIDEPINYLCSVYLIMILHIEILQHAEYM